MSSLNQGSQRGFARWRVSGLAIAIVGFLSVLHLVAAPAETVPATAQFAVGPQAIHPLRGAMPDDWVLLEVFELQKPGVPYCDKLQVNEDGMIHVSFIGNVYVAGLTPRLIEEKIGQLAVEKGFLLPKGGGAPTPQVNVLLLAKERATAPADTAAAPGDIVDVKFYELIAPATSYFARIQVNEQGNLRVGPLGEIAVVGLTAKQIEEVIVKAAGNSRKVSAEQGSLPEVSVQIEGRPAAAK